VRVHSHHMQYGSRYLGAAVLLFFIVILAIVWIKLYRHSKRRRLISLLFGYNELLLGLFIVGLLADDGFGWAFVPLMIGTAPWSFFAPMVAHGPVGGWLSEGLLGNFVLLVVLCGGINSLLLYAITTRVSSESDQTTRRILP
jgi:hypothetical protein